MGIFKPRREKPSQPKAVPESVPAPPDGRIESAIDQAMREGEFEHLPGMGKPLDPEYLKAGPDFLVQKILKEQGFVPDWARLLQAVDRLDEAADALRASALDSTTESLVAAVLIVRNDIVRALNRRVPSAALQRGIKDPGRSP